MKEAFDRARKDNPDSPIVPVIQYVNRVQAEERRLAKLNQEFYELGAMWFGTRIDPTISKLYRYNRIPIEQRKEQWKQALTTLKNRPSEKRIELLNRLASGMQLTGDHVPRVYAQSILQIAFDHPLDFLRDELLGVNFNHQSMLFMEATSDMSGHSKEQKHEFRDFMAREAGLAGKVGLPELFPGISRWLDHTRSQALSH